MRVLFKLTVLVATSTILMGGCAFWGPESNIERTDHVIVMPGERESTQTRRPSNQSPDRNNRLEPKSDQPDEPDDRIEPGTANLEPKPQQDPDQLAQQARQAYDQGKPDRALELYEKALKLRPRTAGYLLDMGSIQFEQKNYAKAQDFYAQTIDVEPDHKQAHLYKGIAHVQTDEPDMARSHLEKVIEMDPDNSTAKRYLNQL